MRDNITPLHRGIRPITPTTAERRMVESEEQAARDAFGHDDWKPEWGTWGDFRSKRHLRIEPPIRWWELSAMLLAAGVIGFALGVGL